MNRQTRAEQLDFALRVQIENLAIWRPMLVDLTPAQRHELHEACIALADAICEIERRDPD